MDRFARDFDLAVGVNFRWGRVIGTSVDDRAAPTIFSARLWADPGFGDLREISVLYVLPAGRILSVTLVKFEKKRGDEDR